MFQALGERLKVIITPWSREIEEVEKRAGNQTVSALGNVTGTTNLNASLASSWTANLTGETTFNFINVPSGVLFVPQVIVKQNASSAYTVSFAIESVVITPQWDTGCFLAL